MLRSLQIAAFVSWVCFAMSAFAQSAEPVADPYLAAAVDALQTGDPELGLVLLEKASTRSDDPRITYYTAFALEKLGRCEQARSQYAAADAAGPLRFSVAAQAALKDLASRCVPARPPAPAPDPVIRARPVRKSPTLATVGWVLTTVGALTLVAVPVKLAFDREIATQSEQYFEQVYECDVDFGELADDCDADAIKSNPQWATYEDRIRTAKRSNIFMIAGGATLLAGGIASVLIGAQRVPVAVVPTTGGAALTLNLKF